MLSGMALLSIFDEENENVHRSFALNYRFAVVSRGGASLALQPKLGLLPQRRSRGGFNRGTGAVANRAIVTAILNPINPIN
jgi:hypothetical protein